MNESRPPGHLEMDGKETRHSTSHLAVRNRSDNPPKLRRQCPDFGIDIEKKNGKQNSNVLFPTIQL